MDEDYTGESWAGSCANGTCKGAEFLHEDGCPRRPDYSEPWSMRLARVFAGVVVVVGLWLGYEILLALGAS